MGETLKFTFDTGFGTRSEHDPVDTSAPILTQADVDAARTEGFITGREEGLVEASNKVQDEFKNALSKITSLLETLLSQQHTHLQQNYDQAHHYAQLIAKKIAKKSLAQYPTEQVITLISECLSHNNNLSHLVIRVHESIAELTKNELQSTISQKNFDGKLIILGDLDVELGDCIIEWADGGVAHDTSSIIAQINQNIVEYFDIPLEQFDTQTEKNATQDEADQDDETQLPKQDENAELNETAEQHAEVELPEESILEENAEIETEIENTMSTTEYEFNANQDNQNIEIEDLIQGKDDE